MAQMWWWWLAGGGAHVYGAGLFGGGGIGGSLVLLAMSRSRCIGSGVLCTITGGVTNGMVIIMGARTCDGTSVDGGGGGACGCGCDGGGNGGDTFEGSVVADVVWSGVLCTITGGVSKGMVITIGARTCDGTYIDGSGGDGGDGDGGGGGACGCVCGGDGGDT